MAKFGLGCCTQVIQNKCNVVDISMNKDNIYQIFIRKVALIHLIYLRDLF